MMDSSMTTTAFTLDGFRITKTFGNGVRYEATELMQGVSEVLCYGTAVFVEKNP